MASKFFKIQLFRKKKDKSEKKQEKNHREPIIVKFFREPDENSPKNVKIEVNSELSDSSSEGKIEGTVVEENKRVRFKPNQKYHDIVVYGLIFMVIATLIVLSYFNLSSVVSFVKGFLKVCTPFIAGGMLAFVLTPIVNWLDESVFEKRMKIKKPKLRMVLAVIITYVLLISLLVAAFTILIPQVLDSITDLFNKTKTLYAQLENNTDKIQNMIPFVDLSVVEKYITDAIPKIIDFLTDWAKDSIPVFLDTSVSIVKGVVNALLTIAVSIYMVFDKRKIAKASFKIIYSIMKPKKAEAFITTGKECFQIFGGFIIGKAIDSLIIGILCFIITSLLGMPYPLLMSVIVGVTNMIPFFGPIIGAIPGVLLYLCLEPLHALIFAIEILILQQFDGWILGPLILGDSTGIRPIWVIFGITVGGAYFGVLGMFLGVPITAVVVFLINKLIEKKLKDKEIDIS